MSIRKVEENEFADFVAILKSSNQKNGVGTRDEEYYHNLKTCFGEQAHFMGVEFEGKLISAGVFIFSKNELVILRAELFKNITKFQLLHFCKII